MIMRRFIQDIKGKLVKLNINACGNLYKIMWGKNSRNYVGAGGGVSKLRACDVDCASQNIPRTNAYLSYNLS